MQKPKLKKQLIGAILFILCAQLQAKKVKFAVDMSGQTVSVNGVHVTGDFQEAAGLGPNGDPGTAAMTKEGNTNIYSLVVDLPAFKKYEYRFVNGDLSYEAEFVPEESRVGYNFVDNRWLYVDSLANDTTFVGAILYGGNAPAGKFLVRYKVNTNQLGIMSPAGFHVAGSYQNFDPTRIRLYSFGRGVYEIIGYLSSGTYGYKFYNGNTAAASENLASTCATSGNRNITVSKDTVLAEVCYSQCLACLDVSIKENQNDADLFKLSPNPATHRFSITSDYSAGYKLSVIDCHGKEVLQLTEISSEAGVDISGLTKGFYFVHLYNTNGLTVTKKLIVD